MRHIRFWLPLTLLGLAFVAFAACGDGDGTAPSATDDAPPPSTATSPTRVSDDGTPPAGEFEGGRDPVEVSPGTEGAGLLVDVRAARHDEGFDRVVFEFDDALPGYRVEYITPPAVACGSGFPLEVAGGALLQVRMTPAAAHDGDGASTFGPQELILGLPAILELESACDFEGEVTWIVGVTAEADFSVADLADPFRVVVDVAHP